MVDNVNLYHSMVTYKEPLLMWHNLGHGRFEKVSDALGPDFNRPVVGRGLATADFLNDGNVGFVVNCRGDYPELMRNQGGNGQPLAGNTAHRYKVQSRRHRLEAETDRRRPGARGPGERRHQLHVRQRSAHSLRTRQAHEDRLARDHVAQRSDGQIDQCASRYNRRGEGGQRASCRTRSRKCKCNSSAQRIYLVFWISRKWKGAVFLLR